MDLKTLINKPTLEQHEMEFILKRYISIRKNVEVDIIVQPIYGDLWLLKQTHLMVKLTIHAITWLKANENKI